MIRGPNSFQEKQYDDFRATELYCSKCRRLMPVRERLLLFLPDGELYEYRCSGCGSSLGTKRVTSGSSVLTR